MDARSLFEILARENAGMLLAFLRTSIRDSAAVDDLFQETMLVAWRRLDDFDHSGAFGAWLRGIAAKLILVHHRHASGRLTVPVDEAALEWFGGQLERMQTLQGDTWRDKLEALRGCVDSLPEHYRDPVRLRYQQQLELSEVAGRLQLKLESLKKRLGRAKQQLYECIQRKISIGEVSG